MTANSTQQLDSKKYVLIISHDIISAQMAGPGIRYYHLAEVLSHKFNVLLAIPNEPDLAIKQAICICLNIVEVTGTLYNFSPTMLRSS